MDCIRRFRQFPSSRPAGRIVFCLLLVAGITAALPAGDALATRSEKRIVAVAANRIGTVDQDPGCPDRGCYFGNGGNWCSEFVSWVYRRAGYPFSGGSRGGWLLNDTEKVRAWFEIHATYVTRDDPDWAGFTPRPGDYVFLGRADGLGGFTTRAHSGIVERLDADGTLRTIEGNNDDRPVGRYAYPSFRTNTTDNFPDGGIVLGFGLRGGKSTRIPNGTARASSSGDGRPPELAFDRRLDTFWRNRTHQGGGQYLEMDFNGAVTTVARIALTFGNHYPDSYRFRFKKNGAWRWSRGVAGNRSKSRTHVWYRPRRNIQAVRVYSLRYSRDDYFSVYEMVIQR